MSKLSSATGFTTIFFTFDGGGLALCDGIVYVIVSFAVLWVFQKCNNPLSHQVLVSSMINYSHALHAAEVLRRRRWRRLFPLTIDSRRQELFVMNMSLRLYRSHDTSNQLIIMLVRIAVAAAMAAQAVSAFKDTSPFFSFSTRQ